MKNTTLFAAAAAASAGVVVVASTEPQQSAVDFGFISFPIHHSLTTKTIQRRDVDAPLFNVSTVSYLIELKIGTPGQPVKVAIDTGSDELWVNPVCSSVKDKDQKTECVDNGQYSVKQSTTAQKSTSSKNIPYGKGDVNIQYYRDSISIPNSTVTLNEVVFGVATSSKDLNEGIMGLGFGNNVNLKYNNMIDTLYLQNVTKSRAFSVALGSANSINSGAISFGGVDTKKFSGKLTQVPMLGPQGTETIRRYWVQLDSVGMTTGGSSNGKSKTYSGSQLPIVIDSGSTLSYLPQSVVSSMATDTGAVWSSSGGVYATKCDQLPAAADSSVDFSFGNGTYKVSVPTRDFFWSMGGDSCVLGAVPVKSGSDSTSLLGDTFMRSNYIVFDQTSDAVFMAPYANCGTNEQAIPASPDGAAAGFTGECSPGQGIGSDSSSGSGGKNAAGKATGEPSKYEFWACAAVLIVGHLVFGMML